MRKIRSAAISAAIALAALGALLVSPAGADTEPVHVGTLMQGMTIKGYDRAVAEANGYEIRTRPDGTEYSAKKGDLSTQGSSTVVGNCGNSYVELWDAPGSGQADYRTGFNVSPAAISYTWWVIIRDNNGTSNRTYGGSLAARNSWTSGFERLGLYAGGNAWATVIPEGSYAVLVNGAVCVSGGPGTVEWIN